MSEFVQHDIVAVLVIDGTLVAMCPRKKVRGHIVLSGNMLFLPTTREQKYKAKQVVDSFFWRVGDTGSALLVFVGTTMLALSLDMFAKVNLVAVLVWLVLAYLIGKEYKRLVATGETPQMKIAKRPG